jgi:proteasome lid subunit RPN8/RPN11
MTREYRLPYREWRRLSRRSYAAQQRGLFEVCGLFAVNRNREIRLFFVRNESRNPGQVDFGWDQFWRAREDIRANRHRYIGMFHSHPVGYAVPGSGDLRGARVNAVLLIHDVCGAEARLWRIIRRGRRKRAIELPIAIERTRRLPDRLARNRLAECTKASV